jgi:hypothetical protein
LSAEAAPASKGPPRSTVSATRVAIDRCTESVRFRAKPEAADLNMGFRKAPEADLAATKRATYDKTRVLWLVV